MTPPPPTPPLAAAAPLPTATPLPPTPTPLPPFEWATVVTPQVRALESGAPPATGYYAGWFGELSEDEFSYDGRTYKVLEILFRESDAEVSVRLDSCLPPTALYGLHIEQIQLRWPTSEHSETECTSSKSSQQRFRFTTDDPVPIGEIPVSVVLVLVAEGRVGTTPKPTPTVQPDAAAPIVVSTPKPAPRAKIVPTNTPAATPRPTPRSIIVPTNTPVPTATPTPHTSPALRHLELKQYMLELINKERTAGGLNPVALGDNIAAQIHAESAIENCFSSHWGVDGLKPYMRYSLAGGYQSNGENGHGLDYCIKASDGYSPIGNVKWDVREAMEGWMDSPGHRRNILRSTHKKVNIGLAWDRYNFGAFQHFEGDYVEYGDLPTIKGRILTLSGSLRNGAKFSFEDDLGVQIYYDPPPHALTRGQLVRTYCYDSGQLVAAMRPPLTGRSYYPENSFQRTYNPCPDPYDVDPNAPAPRSHDEAHDFWQAAYDASQAREGTSHVVPWITASEMKVSGNAFSVKADIGNVPAGVYTIVVWALIDGSDEIVSQYSIFHGVTPPDTYTP